MKKNRIYVKVIPRSSKREVIETGPGEYKVYLNAPPADGRANRELIEILAEYLALPKSAVNIVGGRSARTKIVEIGE
jgi:uncharacterized protein (TIGR00251 family)